MPWSDLTESEKMKIEIAALTEENLIEAPEWESHPYSCKYCLYWEHPELLIDPAKESKPEMFQRKLEWLRRVWAEFGECGKLIYLDGKVVGYAQYAPAEFLPNSKSYPAGPVSEDSVLIACLFIPAKEHRGRGWGALFLKNILDGLQTRGVGAVETFARKGDPSNPSGPLELYLKHGFRVHRDDKEFPLLRLELQKPQYARAKIARSFAGRPQWMQRASAGRSAWSKEMQRFVAFVSSWIALSQAGSPHQGARAKPSSTAALNSS
jgi:GNAT superfamily N-acetyltransferase